MTARLSRCEYGRAGHAGRGQAKPDAGVTSTCEGAEPDVSMTAAGARAGSDGGVAATGGGAVGGTAGNGGEA